MQQAIQTVEHGALPAPVTPAHMLQIAVEQGADLDKLEKLMDLQERWEEREAQKAFTVSMSDFRNRCPAIVKTRSGHNIKYAGLAESIDQIKDLMAECGLSHSWSTGQEGSDVKVTCTVTHILGHSESTLLVAGPDTTGSKNSIQAIGSTVSYLQRYTLFAILGLASQDADTDGNIQHSAPPADFEAAINSLVGAADLEELQVIFKAQWKKYPKHRPALTAAKDARKKELSNAK